MNSIIINEFEKLIKLTNQQYEQYLSDKNKKEADINLFRLKQIKKVLGIIKKFDKEITFDNFDELSSIKGIGTGTLNRIEEILITGKLSEVENFKDDSDEKKKIIEELESVINIGKSKAIEFYEQGIKSVEDLKNKHKKGEIELNNKILLGLKYYGIVKTEIPREEITKVKKILDKIIEKLNKKENKDSKFILEIAGSYRRGKDKSGDIDVLVTKLNTNENTNNDDYLSTFIKYLKKDMKINNNKPLIIDDMTDKNIKTKYMGFLKLLDNPVRRIDVRFVSYDSFFTALLYFTGSADLNKYMREIAKTKNMKLSEYGLFDENDNKIIVKSEKEVFDKLNLDYIDPKQR